MLFLAQNAPETAWRPGSARTRWGSSQRSPRSPSWITGVGPRGEGAPGRGGKEGREREGEGGKGEGRKREGKGEGRGRLTVASVEINSWIRPWSLSKSHINYHLFIKFHKILKKHGNSAANGGFHSLARNFLAHGKLWVGFRYDSKKITKLTLSLIAPLWVFFQCYVN